MKRKIQILILLIFTVIFICPSSSLAQENRRQKETEALKAAQRFLSLVDAGEYGKSYSETSSLFQRQVTRQEWVSKISHVRPLFGAVISRQKKKANYLTSAPGAPDGEYVLIIFQTSFKNKDKAFEFVTTNLDTDGKWRVSGYFIR